METSFVTDLLKLVGRFEMWRDLLWDEDLQFFVNVGTAFKHATADAEQVTAENLPLLEQAIADCRRVSSIGECYAGVLFAARVRKTRPTDNYYGGLPKVIRPLFDAVVE